MWHRRQVSESSQKLLSCKTRLLSTPCTCPAQPFVFMVTQALAFPFSPLQPRCVSPAGALCSAHCCCALANTGVRLGMEGGGSDAGWRIGWEGFSALCTKVAFVFIPSVVCCQQALCAAASFCVGLWWIFWGYASGLVPNLNNSGNAHAVPCLIPSLLLQELSVSFQARVCTLNADKNTQRGSRFCCLLCGSASCCGVGQALLRLGPVEGNSPRFLPPVHFTWRIKDQTGAFVGWPASLKNEWIKEMEKRIYFFLLLFRRS